MTELKKGKGREKGKKGKAKDRIEEKDFQLFVLQLYIIFIP